MLIVLLSVYFDVFGGCKMLEWNFFGKLVGYMDCFGKIMCISFDVFGWICLCENVLG